MDRTLVVLGSLLLACGSGSRGGPGGGDGEGDGGSVAASELVIEMRPVSERAWTGLLMGDSTQVSGEEIFDFAWAEGYPASMEIAIGDTWTPCGMLMGTFAIESVESLDDGLAVMQSAPAAFRIAPTGEGDFTAIVRGTFSTAEGNTSCVEGEVPFELTVRVPVRRPVGVVLDPAYSCAEADRIRMESDAHLDPELFVQLVDAAGETFVPENAESTHPATLTLRTISDASLELHDPELGLDALVVSGAPGPVRVFAFDALQDTIDHVAPEDIEVGDIHFALLGVAGTSTPLQSGEVYGDTGWSRTSRSIGIAVSGLFVDGQPVCTLPREGGFTLASSTPQRCVTYEAIGHGNGPYGGGPFDPTLPLSADVIASGACTLRLEGPDYGLAEDLGVEILNAESLIDLGSDGRG
jgi:hypothetical protein